MLEPATLRHFRAVAAEGSVRHAASRLYVAQSAVSRRIAALEAELGVPLFERHARGMQLTDAGRLLLAFADEFRDRLGTLRQQFERFESLQAGHVKFASVEGLLSSFVPEALRAFAVDYPGISIDVHAMGSHVVAEAVAEHRVELGILFGTPPRPDLRTLGRMRQPLCAIVSPNHPLARRRGCSLREAAGFPLVLPDRSFGIRQLVERVAARDRITLRPVAETNTLGFAWRLVSHFDDRVTFMPRETVLPEVEAGRLVALPLDDRLLRETWVTLVASAGRTLAPAAARLADTLRLRMAEGGSDARRTGSRGARKSQRSKSS